MSRRAPQRVLVNASGGKRDCCPSLRSAGGTAEGSDWGEAPTPICVGSCWSSIDTQMELRRAPEGTRCPEKSTSWRRRSCSDRLQVERLEGLQWERRARRERLHLKRLRLRDHMRRPSDAMSVGTRIRRIESSRSELRNCDTSCPVAPIIPKADADEEANAGGAQRSSCSVAEARASRRSTKGHQRTECSTCSRSTPSSHIPRCSLRALRTLRMLLQPTAL